MKTVFMTWTALCLTVVALALGAVLPTMTKNPENTRWIGTTRIHN